MLVRHYYHIWAGGAWVAAATEHAQALTDAAFPVRPLVGLVGQEADRQAVRGLLPTWDVTVEADYGFEQVTLTALRDWALKCEQPAAILYTHTKGAMADPGGTNTTWRRAMTKRVVGDWQACVKLLEHHDAVGCHWKTAHEYPQLLDEEALAEGCRGIFAGNFWWATAEFIAKLPPPVLDAERHSAERWLGLGDPDVVDLFPGWPLFGVNGIISPQH